MSLKSFTSNEMYQTSAPMVEVGAPARTAIEKIPTLAVMLSQLEAAHKGIAAVRVQPEDPRVQDLSVKEAVVDGRHDDKLRGIHGALTGLALLSNRAQELLQLRDWIMPEGLAHTQLTYRGEAGHAGILASAITPEIMSRMKTVKLDDKTLYDIFQEYVALARELGAMEDERARLSPPAVTPAQAASARYTWVRVMNALIANAELAGLDEQTDRLLFASLRAAEQTANTRVRRQQVPVVPPPAQSTALTTDPMTPKT